MKHLPKFELGEVVSFPNHINPNQLDIGMVLEIRVSDKGNCLYTVKLLEEELNGETIYIPCSWSEQEMSRAVGSVDLNKKERWLLNKQLRGEK